MARKADPSTVAFGKIIQDAREAADMTQTQLATALNVQQQTVSRWEAGRMIPRVAIIPDIAKALGLDSDELAAAVVHQAVDSPPRDVSARLAGVETRMAGMEELLQQIVKRLPERGWAPESPQAPRRRRLTAR